jgi:hypothetical protein
MELYPYIEEHCHVLAVTMLLFSLLEQSWCLLLSTTQGTRALYCMGALPVTDSVS